MSKQLAPWIEGRLRPEPLASRLVYNTFFKRAPLYMASCMAAAVIGGVAFDKTIDALWDMNTKGVSRRLHTTSPFVARSALFALMLCGQPSPQPSR